MALTPQETRQKIIEAARKAFTTEGYRTSIDRIAQLANVAKQTVYNHFPTKDQLFDESTREYVSLFTVPLSTSALNVREALTEFAKRYRACALQGSCFAGMRMIVAEALRFPEMAARTYELGPQEVESKLAEYLGRAMVAKTVRSDNPKFAADMLIGMLINTEHKRLLFGITQPIENEEERIEAIIDCFMRAYAPPAH